VAPSTSAIPTTPLTASVSTAQLTKMSPASHAVPRCRVTRSVTSARRAPLVPWRRTLIQWSRNGDWSRAPTNQSARQMRSGMGLYEPMLRSGRSPQKSRRNASSQWSFESGSVTERTYGLARSASCSSKMKFVWTGFLVKRAIETKHSGTSKVRSTGSSPRK